MRSRQPAGGPRGGRPAEVDAWVPSRKILPTSVSALHLPDGSEKVFGHRFAPAKRIGASRLAAAESVLRRLRNGVERAVLAVPGIAAGATLTISPASGRIRRDHELERRRMDRAPRLQSPKYCGRPRQGLGGLCRVAERTRFARDLRSAAPIPGSAISRDDRTALIALHFEALLFGGAPASPGGLLYHAASCSTASTARLRGRT